MDFFEIANLECQVAIEKSNNDAIISSDNFSQFMSNTSYLTEAQVDVLYESKIGSLGQKIVEAIDAIMKAISDFVYKVKDKFISLIQDKETKKKLKEIEDSMNRSADSEKGKTSIEIYTDEEGKKRLDEYIKQMVVLERKLMDVKSGALMDVPGTKKNLHVIEAQEILHDLDELNKKYDAEFLTNNEKIIKMASKDAIRFNEKQLNNVKINYDAVEKGSNEVLAIFKKDAQGCDVQVKLNGIQKMSNSIGTRVRQFINASTQHQHMNLKKILALAVAVPVAKKAGEKAIEKISQNQTAKDSAMKLAGKAISKAPKILQNDLSNVVSQVFK